MLPADLAYHLSTAQLGAVPTGYHSLTDEWHTLHTTFFEGNEPWGTFSGLPVPTPTSRVEYYTPGTWRLAFSYRNPD